MNRITSNAHALAAVLLLALPACSGNTLGTLGDVLGGMPAAGAPQGGELLVEIRGVDTQRQTLQVATEDGQTGSVRFDQNTAVIYRQQQYAVTALERGDVVRMQVQETSQGALYASRIDVQQSVQERTGAGNGAVQQFAGRISRIDHESGTFLLQTQGGNLTVSLPYNPPRSTLDYFRRLRTGDTVRLEATLLSGNRAEVHRFL